ncbi:hypothetical protein LPJ66_006165, partial [Kickxella alabastrina]
MFARRLLQIQLQLRVQSRVQLQLQLQPQLQIQLRRGLLTSPPLVHQPPCPHTQLRRQLLHTSPSQPKASSPYLHPDPSPQPPHPLTLDHPYPAPPPADNYHTLSFYSFFPIPATETTRLRDELQKEWTDKLCILGRIYVCEQGINAQISVPVENTAALRQWLENHRLLCGRIPRFNWAIEQRRAFSALHVRVRPLVATGCPVTLDELGHEPEYLDPAQWDRELQQNEGTQQQQPLLIDMRNSYEFRIGKFTGAICPDVDTFREEMDAVREICTDKEKSIYMYCTGGIRCSVAGALLKAEGYKSVKTLRGGVIAYGHHVRQPAEQSNAKQSLFRGKNFTFDKRLGEEVTEEVLAHCDQCGSPCDTFTNCANRSCNLLFIQCPACALKHQNTCGTSL